MLRKLLAATLLSAHWMFSGAAAAGIDISQQRSLFLETESLLKRNRLTDAETNMQLLRDYPLYPTLLYLKLQDRLWMQNDIEKFIKEFGDTLYADKLRKLWLRYAASNERWDIVLRYYRQDDDTALQCLWRQAQYQTGAATEALQAAGDIWTVGKPQPQECEALFTALQQSPYLTEDLIWRRFESSLQAGNTGIAVQTKRLLSTAQQAVADVWLQIHQQPQQIQDWGIWQKPYDKLGAIYVHGVKRLAENNLEAALVAWEQRSRQLSIDEAHADQIEKALGISLARQKDMRAYSHLSRIASSSDAAVREWTIRAALLEQNWQHVNAALQRLSDDEKRAPQWQYWMARALQETGRNVQAEEAFEQIAQDRSFYGFLAADHTGRTYQIGDRPAPASTGDIDAIRTRRSFRIVEEFRALGRNGDAAQQWWFAVGQLDKHHKMLAAKLAQQWGWHPVAIFTLARADYWDDINLRFPLVYPNQIKHYAAMHDLRPALVYGLVRQESVFDTNAYSSAGARGLMQLMPETGQHIAKQFNERWRSASDLFDPEINLKYGTFYYKQLLERFDGNAALAAAGYNAGPNRVFRWRPYLRPVPADVWIETIPFKETRKYVSSVLTYSVIYQYRLGLGNLKLKDLIPDVYPG